MARYGQGSMWEPEQPGPQAQAPQQQQVAPTPTGPGTQTLNEMGGAPYGAQPVDPGMIVNPPGWDDPANWSTSPGNPNFSVWNDPNRPPQDPNKTPISPPSQVPDFGQGGGAAKPPPATMPDTGGYDQSLQEFLSRFADPNRNRALSNMGIPENAQAAFDMARPIFNQAGGNFDALLGEIGGHRMMDRIRQLAGNRGVDPGSVIQIGNGQTIDPSGWSTGGGGGEMALRGGQQAAPFGYNKLGNPRQVEGRTDFGGGGGGGGGGGVPAGGGGTGDWGWANQALQSLYGSGGVDPSLLEATQQSLRENTARQFQSASPVVSEAMQRRGITGAGIEGGALADMMQNLQGQAGTNLRDVSTAMGLQGMQNQLGAAQTAAGLGTTERGQDINRNLGWGDLGLRRELGLGGLDLQRLGLNNQFALGQGGLALQNQGLNLDAANVFGNQQLQWAQLANALQQGGNQGLTDLLNQYLGGLQTSAGGGIG